MRKLTVDVKHIEPRNGDTFGWSIINNGTPLTFTSSNLSTTTYNKTFVSSNIEIFNTGRIVKLDDNYEFEDVLQSFNGDVYDIKLRNDGKIVIVGNFTQYGDTISERIIILNSDYTIFKSYSLGTGANGIIRTIVRSNNDIFIGGDFTTFGGVSTNRIAHINSSGNLVASFTTNIMSAPTNKGFNARVNKIVIIGPNLYITGNFTNFNNNVRNRIISLTTTGFINSAFFIGDGLNNEGLTIHIYNNTSLIIGGFFTTYRLATVNRIVRVDLDGFFNNTTNFGTGFSGSLPTTTSPQSSVTSITEDNSGNLLIGGAFTNYNGNSCSGLIRISSNGTALNTFGAGFNAIVRDVKVLDNDKIVVGGDFTTYKNLPALYNSILQDNNTFIDSIKINNSVRTILESPIDECILGGDFTTLEVSGTASQTLTNIPLAIDTIDFGTGFDDTVRYVEEANNEVYYFGNYSEYNSNTALNVSKIDTDGTFTLGFTGSTSLPNNAVRKKHTLLSDGSMIFIGSANYNGVAGSTNGRILKFNSDFTRDTGFNSGATGFGSPPHSYIVNDDDYVYVNLVSDDLYNGTSVSGLNIVKIDASTGAYVSQITKPTVFQAVFPQLKMANNGDILYTLISPTNGYNIARTGTFSFSENLGVNNVVELSNGNLVIVGRFGSSQNLVDNKYSVSGCRSVAVISADAQTLIQGNINSGWSSNASYLVYRDNLDRIYISRPSETTVSYNGVTIPSGRKLIRLNNDLTLDNSFIVNITNNFIDDVLFKDNYIIIVGSFTKGVIYVDYEGNELTEILDLSGTIQNTYDNFNQFHTITGITHSIDGDIVRMEYEFDDDEIVITDVYDTPDHVEITFDNESLLITDLVDEVVVRSPHFIISSEDDFDTVDFDIKVWEGNVFDGASQSVLYSKTKQKISPLQNSIYINVSNLVREDLEIGALSFLDLEELNAKPLSNNVSKWVEVDYTTYLLGATVSQNKDLLYVLDGYLDPEENQFIPRIIKTGNERYINKLQQNRIYFQVNRLQRVYYITSDGESEDILWDIDIFDNKKFVQSIKVKTGDFNWIEYIFEYDDTFGGFFEERIKYNLYKECFYDVNSLVYKNKWGVLESIAVSKKLIQTLDRSGDDFTRSIVDFNGSYDISRHTNKQFNIIATTKYEVNTDFIPEYMNVCIKEMLLSEEIWILTTDNQIIPVIIEDSNKVFKTKRNDGMIQYTFNVKTSHQQIKNIL